MSAELLERKTLAAGTVVFKKGDQAGCAFIVQDGTVEIYIGEKGSETVLATIPKGGIFGEMALIDDSPRMAGARMSHGGTLVIIKRNTIDQKLAKADPFIRTLLNIFVQTIRRLSDEQKK